MRAWIRLKIEGYRLKVTGRQGAQMGGKALKYPPKALMHERLAFGKKSIDFGCYYKGKGGKALTCSCILFSGVFFVIEKNNSAFGSMNHEAGTWNSAFSIQHSAFSI